MHRENTSHIFEKILDHKFPMVIFLRNETKSTNADAKNMLLGGEKPPFIALAKSQSAAYGRMGNVWESDAIGNLYVSFALKMTARIARNMMLFTRHIAVEICASLAERFSVAATVKWPNDICIESKKVCGLLLEVVRNGADVFGAVLGVGLNILYAPPLENAPYAATCLGDFSRKKLDFDGEAIAAIGLIIASIGGFETVKNAKICEKWNAFDAMCGKGVEVSIDGSVVHGKCRGIGESGELLIEEDGGIMVGIDNGRARMARLGQT